MRFLELWWHRNGWFVDNHTLPLDSVHSQDFVINLMYAARETKIPSENPSFAIRQQTFELNFCITLRWRFCAFWASKFAKKVTDCKVFIKAITSASIYEWEKTNKTMQSFEKNQLSQTDMVWTDIRFDDLFRIYITILRKRIHLQGEKRF